MQRILETTSFLILLVVIALRPLVSETYDSAGTTFAAALPEISDPTPLRTLAFDLVILLAALGWLVARAMGKPRPYRRLGIEWGAALILVGAVASCLFAGNKRLAINAAVDWLCNPLLAITLAQFMHRAALRSVLLAVILASACAQTFYCAEQFWSGFDETWQHYLSIREQFWADQGVPLDSGRVESFEQRLLAREATGALPHSNVTGSYLALCGICGLGVAIGAWRRRQANATSADHEWPRLAAAVAAVPAVALLGAIPLTKSEGALVAAEAALSLGILLWGFWPWFARHRLRALTLGWIAFGIAALAVIGHGLKHDSLPGVSLTFRWQYWTTAARMVADHPLTGVGRENFGRHYLAYKSIQSPEEVSNPHNLFVQAAADWGVIGLLGMTLMVIGASYAVVRASEHVRTRAGPEEPEPTPRTWFAWGAGVCAALCAGIWFLLGSGDLNFQYYRTVTTALAWCAGFGGFAFALHRCGFAAGHGSAARRAAALGLVAFILHDTINFALFVPGTATTAFALLAFCVTGQQSGAVPADKTAAQRSPSWLALVMMIALAVVLATAVIPVARSLSISNAAERRGHIVELGRISGWPVYALWKDAANADPLDSTPSMRRAAWLLAVSRLPDHRIEALRLADSAVDEAIRRDPHHLSLRRMHIRVLRAQAEGSTRDDDHRAVVHAARDALSLYPQDPRGLVLLADCLLDAGRALDSHGALDSHPALDSRDILREAFDTYQRALELDDQRLPWERLRRFRDRERKEIITKQKRALHPTGSLQHLDNR